ncbi:DNA polymerase I, partial [bacterium]|nr:DNA polymerase I [bacterium]
AFQVRKNAERMAVNTPIQGSAADLMKIAMLRVHEMIAKEEFRTRMLMQVHDELVFESPEDEIKIFSKKLNEVMVNAIKLKLPLEVEISSGDIWLDARN